MTGQRLDGARRPSPPPTILPLALILIFAMTGVAAFNPAGNRPPVVPHTPSLQYLVGARSRPVGGAAGAASRSPLFVKQDGGSFAEDASGKAGGGGDENAPATDSRGGSRPRPRPRGALSAVASRIVDGVVSRGRSILAASALLAILLPVSAPPPAAASAHAAVGSGAERARMYSRKQLRSNSAPSEVRRDDGSSSSSRSPFLSVFTRYPPPSKVVGRSQTGDPLLREEVLAVTKASLGSTFFLAGAAAGGTLVGRSLLSVLDEDEELLAEVQRDRRRAEDEYLEIVGGRKEPVEVRFAEEGGGGEGEKFEEADAEAERRRKVESVLSNANTAGTLPVLCAMAFASFIMLAGRDADPL